MMFDELDAIIADTECAIGGIRWTALWGSMGSGFTFNWHTASRMS